MRPITTRFGSCSPSLEKAISSLSALWGETIVPSGGAAANVLGLSNQNPVQPVFLTSGPTRILHFHRLRVRLRHAPPWQLVVPDGHAGAVIRALAWLGPREVQDALEFAAPRLSSEDVAELARTRATMPGWMARPVSAFVARG